MAVYHHIPDGNHASSQPYPPMVVPFNPCGGCYTGYTARSGASVDAFGETHGRIYQP